MRHFMELIASMAGEDTSVAETDERFGIMVNAMKALRGQPVTADSRQKLHQIAGEFSLAVHGLEQDYDVSAEALRQRAIEIIRSKDH